MLGFAWRPESMSLGVQLRELFAKVGSYYPIRENFRLTPELKAAFTEKLKADPTELSGLKTGWL